MPAIFQADYSFWQGIQLVDSTCSGKDLNRKHGFVFFCSDKIDFFFKERTDSWRNILGRNGACGRVTHTQVSFDCLACL